MKLILAQGNPGDRYKHTRHNTGFIALDQYGERHDASWRIVDKFNARIAEVMIGGEKVVLAMPQTFYNETGLTARKIIDFYKLDPASDVLVIHDELALPFGTIRTREKGSPAGNNGIKSLNAHIGELYQRIRIGVSVKDRHRMDDVNFVLGTFSKEESDTLTETLLPRVTDLIDAFINGTLENTSIKA